MMGVGSQNTSTARLGGHLRDEEMNMKRFPSVQIGLVTGYVFNKSWRQKARVRPRHLMFNDQTLSTLSVPSFCQTSTTTSEHL